MREDRLLFHRLIMLSCACHIYFWITFHRSSSWAIQILFAITACLQLTFALQGPITNPEVGQKSQQQSFETLHLKFYHIMSLLMGAPVCQMLQWVDTKLCNQQIYFGHLLKSFVPEEGPVEVVPRKKCIVLFHRNATPSLSWHRLQRHLNHEQGSFRIFMNIQSPFHVFQATAQWLANAVRMSTNADHDKRHQDTQRQIATTENVPCVLGPDRGRLSGADMTFTYELHAMCAATALGLDIQDIYHGLPTNASSACTTLRMSLKKQSPHELNQIQFVPPLGPSASFQEFVLWKSKQLEALCARNLYIENEQKQFLDIDNTLCGLSDVNEMSQNMNTVYDTCYK